MKSRKRRGFLWLAIVAIALTIVVIGYSSIHQNSARADVVKWVKDNGGSVEFGTAIGLKDRLAAILSSNHTPPIRQIKLFASESAPIALPPLDLSPLARVTMVEEFLCKNRTITSLESLRRLKNIQKLILHNCDVRSIEPLEDLSELKVLDISDNPRVTSIYECSKLKKLETLDVSGTSISTLKPVYGIRHLRTINANATPVDRVDLGELPGIEKLSLAGTNVNQLGQRTNQSRLRHLDLRATPILDIKLLAELSELEFLDLSATSVLDFTPLTSLRLRQLALRRLGRLDMNAVGRISTLLHLDLRQSQVKSLLALKHCKDLRTIQLELHYTDSNERKALLTLLPRLRMTDGQWPVRKTEAQVSQ